MIESWNFLRDFSFGAVLLRLVLATAFGGIIGLGREKKRRPAGFRTYMLVCLGAALTMITSQYMNYNLLHDWAMSAAEVGVKTDVSRLGAQVINGTGFLCGATIFVTKRQEVKGLTTAAALWACACTGLAIGAGFYELVLVSFALVVFTMYVLPNLERRLVENSRNMNLYVEFDSLDSLGEIIGRIKYYDVQIYDAEINRGNRETPANNAIFNLKLSKAMPHAEIVKIISEMNSVSKIEEL